MVFNMYRLAQKETLGLAEKKKVKIKYVDKKVLDSLSENKPHMVSYQQSFKNMMRLQCLV